ncbi:hypothetical protein PV04_09168 [Phialophora macrospora]|uniref:Extracellular membrane protein CFEM domain-containing protein n=1 Tax=Phialophora macrospora TaxID=1851006 RepID=A0A0D2DPP7_9EURO|nr:hypothetical protein PV04_09168 [Phialophora macrospora]
MELRLHARFLLAILLYALVRNSSASASFSSIQPIVGFSTSCTLAYDTPVNLCENDDFQGIGGTGSCSSDCQTSLAASQVFVQRRCAGQQADANSVIGHLFLGDIVDFLCGDNNAASTTATTAQVTQPSNSAQSTMSMAVDTVTPSTSTEATSTGSAATIATGSSGTGSVSGTTTLTTSTVTKSTETTSSTFSSIPTSIESETSSLTSTSSSSGTSSSASATSTSQSQGSGGGSGGGSPFDNTFSASASSQTIQMKLLSLSSLVAFLLAVW